MNRLVHRAVRMAVAASVLMGCGSGGGHLNRDGGTPDRSVHLDSGQIDSAKKDGGAPPSDGRPGLNPTDVCVAALRAQCERLATCRGDVLAKCLEYAVLCPDYYFNADSARTVAGIAACIPAFSARTCTDVIMGVFPSCFVQGRRAVGAGCAFPSQCASGVCGSGFDQMCATCADGAHAAGATCTGTNCTSGSFCNGGTCASSATLTHAGAGQPCDLTGPSAIGCSGDLICASTDGGSRGICTQPPGAGQPCAVVGFSGSVCAAGTICSSGTCKAVVDAGASALVQPGDPCSSTGCPAPLFCSGGRCQALSGSSCPATDAGSP